MYRQHFKDHNLIFIHRIQIIAILTPVLYIVFLEGYRYWEYNNLQINICCFVVVTSLLLSNSIP